LERQVILAGLLIAAGLLGWTFGVEPRLLGATRLEVPMAGMPQSLDGTRIALLSDLHGAFFGKDQRRIRALLTQARPDLICFAGDLVDYHRGGAEAGARLLAELSEIAPLFYVWGNHDYLSGLPALRAAVAAAGAGQGEVEGGWRSLNLPGGELRVAGSPRSWSRAAPGPAGLVGQARTGASGGTPVIVLMHSPTPGLVEEAVAAGAGVVLAGHTHGGQLRAPLVGAIWVPNQGILPRWAWGLHRVGQSGHLCVTRGLGTSVWPGRFLCAPEVMILTLRAPPASDQE
jgi:hypothetical protein